VIFTTGIHYFHHFELFWYILRRRRTDNDLSVVAVLAGMVQSINKAVLIEG
jgi:hypothetical protein